ncbi:hypothetical protein [Bacillus cereus group sp. BfR-BA-02730]|uniref:hypothetical protein n=1 Tax=unclassified Bacillus cereus group TaxID=2750818 RepID=UPI001F57017B|nr:hypothetical protein [Bacillus cereus group sp. BfR-BA-02730]MDX5808204.1 hypothetical protein [Bacillus cereus group sp. BfR-BA-02730]
MKKILKDLANTLAEANEELTQLEKLDGNFHMDKNRRIYKKIGEIRGLEKAIEIVKSEQL